MYDGLGRYRSRCGSGLTLHSLHPLCELGEFSDKLAMVLVRCMISAFEPLSKIASRDFVACSDLIQLLAQIAHRSYDGLVTAWLLPRCRLSCS